MASFTALPATRYLHGMPVLPKEPVGISPRVDCVFRALLADPDHVDRLVDFLNAVLQRSSAIVSVQLRNPIQPSEFIDDGQIVVDVIATDAAGEVFQVEMQSWNHAALKERMLYAWATLYKAQLEKGDKYTELRRSCLSGLWTRTRSGGPPAFTTASASATMLASLS